MSNSTVTWHGAVVVTLVTIAIGVIDAQGPRRPTGLLLRGRVVDDSSASVPYARVRVSGAKGSIRSDADGRFAIDLPDRGTLVISKSGFVTVEHQLPLTAGATDFRLIRAAALTGRVANEFGEPVVAAKVIALGVDSRVTSAPNAITDDRGEYRIGGLAPGRYHVAVQTFGAELSTPDLQFLGNAMPAPKIAALHETTFTTFYPGVLDEGEAENIAVAPGEERGDIDLRVLNSRSLRQPSLISLPLPPVIDQRQPEANGATIQGVVIDTQNRPLAFAQVTIDGNAQPDGNQGAFGFYSTTVADERGRFAVTGLRAGAYAVRAAKPGYSPSLESMAVPMIRLGVGEVRNQVVTLLPWSAVSGRIRDEFGDPVQGVRVSLLLSRYERGRKRMADASVSPALTNDRGEFRLFRIPPGEYMLRAAAEALTAPELTDYPPAFYPGTLSGADAKPFVVELGAELPGLDVQLIATPTAKISGRTFDSSGQPTTQLRLTLVSGTGVDSTLTAQINGDGTFQFENVPPGQYILKADSGRTNTFTEGEFVAMSVSVGQADIEDLHVRALAGSTITGRFVFDRSVRTSDPPPTAVRISAVPEDFDLAPAYAASTQANADGVFQLRGVNGRRRLQVTRVPPRYMVQSLLVNGRDVLDDVIAFGRANQSLDDVEVVLTDRVTTIKGTVDEGRDRVRAGAHVIVFSTDRARWYQASRHLQHGVTSPTGEFTFTGVPPGSYFAAALAAIPAGDDAWQDPAFLDAIRPSAAVISISDGLTDTVALRMTRP